MVFVGELFSLSPRYDQGEFKSRRKRRSRRGNEAEVFFALVWCLRNNYTFAAMDFGRRLGASDEHIPQWICKERATKSAGKGAAALRVALKLGCGCVARRLQPHFGGCADARAEAPRALPRPNLSATKAHGF